MAVVGTLGTGVFIGASQALAVGGPGTLLLAYLLLSLLAYSMTNITADVASHLHARDGTLVTHAYRYGSRHFAFAISYLRWYTLGLFVPYEITTAIVNLGFWDPGQRVAVRVVLAILVIFATNFLPEKAFKQSEILFTGIKLILMVGLVVFSVALFATGRLGARGFEYWRDPGAMNEQVADGALGRTFGLVQCMLFSTIAFTLLPEQVVYRAEQKELSPTRSVTGMSRRDSILVFALYLLSAFSMGVVCPSDEPLLTNEEIGAGYSPYVLAIMNAGIRTLPTVVTTAILISSVASGRTFLFLSSRTLYTLAENVRAPSMFVKQNRYGAPYAAVLGSGVFSLLGFLSARWSSTVVFNWFMLVLTTSGCLSWMGSCVIYLNYRRILKAANALSPSSSNGKPVAAYFGMVCSILLAIANGVTVANPERFNIRNLVPAYFGIPVFLILYYGHQVLAPAESKTSRAEEISLDRVSVRAGPSRLASHWFGRVRAHATPPPVDDEA